MKSTGQDNRALYGTWHTHITELINQKPLISAKQSSRRRQWHPIPVLLPGKSQGQGSLVGCSPWGREESDTNERLHFHFSLSCIGEATGTHSSVLAWRIPGTGSLVGCRLWGHTESDTTGAT